MKKVLLFGIIAILAIGISGISYASVDETFEVAIVNVKGDVSVDETGRGQWVSPTVGDKLRTGAVIKTGYDGYAEVVYDSDGLNVLRIAANTELEIEESMAEMKEGSVMADFRNLTVGSQFQVKTPNSICGIRGSGMGVDHIYGMTVVKAFEDKVYVQGVDSRGRPVGREVTIPEGWKSNVDKNGDVAPPENLSANETLIWEAWQNATSPADVVQGETDQGVDPDLDEMGQDLDRVKEDAAEEEAQPEVSP